MLIMNLSKIFKLTLNKNFKYFTRVTNLNIQKIKAPSCNKILTGRSFDIYICMG